MFFWYIFHSLTHWKFRYWASAAQKLLNGSTHVCISFTRTCSHSGRSLEPCPTDPEGLVLRSDSSPLSGLLVVGRTLDPSVRQRFTCKCAACRLPKCVSCKIAQNQPHAKCHKHLRRSIGRDCAVAHPCHGCDKLLHDEKEGYKYSLIFKKICSDREAARRRRNSLLSPLPWAAEYEEGQFASKTPSDSEPDISDESSSPGTNSSGLLPKKFCSGIRYVCRSCCSLQARHWVARHPVQERDGRIWTETSCRARTDREAAFWTEKTQWPPAGRRRDCYCGYRE